MPRAPVAMTAADLADAAGADLRGDGERILRGAAPLESAADDELTFLANPAYRGQVAGSRAGGIVVPPEAASEVLGTALVASHPYAAWARALAQLFPEAEAEPGIHHTAIVEPDAVVSPRARVDAHAVIRAHAEVADGAWIEAGVVIGPDSRVGENTRIGPNTTLGPRTWLGSDIRIHAGVHLGAAGFGLAPEGEGYRPVPQVGRVVVEEGVTIGAGTAVDRAALEETRIGAGTHIDNLVQIGHNCRIGPNCVISGQAGISGSTQVGAGCVIAGQVGVTGHTRIPDGTTLTAKAGVISRIDEPGVYSGFPHRPHAQWQREQAGLRHVGQLRQRVRALEKALGQQSEGA